MSPCLRTIFRFVSICSWSSIVCTSGVRIRNRQSAFSAARRKHIASQHARHGVKQPGRPGHIQRWSQETYGSPDGSLSSNQTMANQTSNLTNDVAKYTKRWHMFELPSANRTNSNWSELPLKYSEPMAILMALGGGIGAPPSKHQSEGLRSRVHWQDKGIMVLNVVIYFVSLGLWASFTYRRAMNNSPVTYFCQPGRIDGSMSGHSLDHFLETFTQAPQTTLQISGYERVARGTRGHNSIHWQGEKLRSVFALSFDLSSWMVHDVVSGEAQVGVAPGDVRRLDHFLSRDRNDLTFVEITKDVQWSGFDELATNIKQHIRQQGFDGITSVWLSKPSTERIHKNRPWANFLQARTTFLLSWLSIVGVIFYSAYMFLRSRKVAINSFHKVDISIDDYWPLIVDKLNVDSLPRTPMSRLTGDSALPMRANSFM